MVPPALSLPVTRPWFRKRSWTILDLYLVLNSVGLSGPTLWDGCPSSGNELLGVSLVGKGTRIMDKVSLGVEHVSWVLWGRATVRS